MPDLKTELSKVTVPEPTETPNLPAPSRRASTPRKMREDVERHRMTSTPHFSKMLLDRFGGPKAAAMIGMSKSSVVTAVKRETISATAEIAARGIMETIRLKEELEQKSTTTEASTDVFIAAKIPAEKVAGFKAVCEAMGIRLRTLT